MAPPPAFDPRGLTRPAPVLLGYYTLVSLATLAAFPVVWLVSFFRYQTLQYAFTDDGFSMSWGILFRREVHLTYRRIQDIHVTRNLLQRWMGLATISIQTASGSATPEMQIEGLLEFEPLRDFLYMKMRGAKGLDKPEAPALPESAPSADEALALLRRIASDLEVVVSSLPARKDSTP
ncbi:PH domain-containing protein [Archangium primigenium]|uniref:PH domain-containing protein n=1 Tax=[Archangium] primigenium TaxID=2792470 RepID=UPI001EF84349|nr:PH domain-containing protein [Archangium primigenium]